jgi:nitrous oxide reductase
MKRYDIAKELGVDPTTVSRDIAYLVTESQNYLNNLAKETLPFMYQVNKGVNKGDNVTVHFYNVDPVTDERHSFTIGAPYNVDADIAFGESDVVSFIANHEGIFQYYCKYHLPVMAGQLQVVP